MQMSELRDIISELLESQNSECISHNLENRDKKSEL